MGFILWGILFCAVGVWPLGILLIVIGVFGAIGYILKEVYVMLCWIADHIEAGFHWILDKLGVPK